MTSSHFVPEGQCLLSHTVAHIARLAQQDFRQITVILPTGRLGHYVLGALAAQRGAIMPPKLHTLAGFFRDADPGAADMAGAAEPLPQAAAALWLKTILAEAKDRRHVQPHHAGELMVFYKELIEANLWESWFEQLQDYVAGECFHHPIHLEAIMTRFEEVRAALGSWRQQLADHSLEPEPDGESARAERVARHISQGGLDDRIIVVAGITTMAPRWLPVFTALAERHPDCHFILPEPPALIASEQPMAPFLAAIGEGKGLASPAPQRAAEDIVMVEAEDAIAEVDFVFGKIRELLTSTDGLSPSHIAVLVPSESQYSGILTSRQRDIPANLAIAQPLSASVIGSWWLTLAGGLSQGYAPLAIYDVLRHPLTAPLIAALGSAKGSQKGSSNAPPATKAKDDRKPLPETFWHKVYSLLTTIKPLPERVNLSQFTAAFAERYPDRAAPWQELAEGYDLLQHQCHVDGGSGMLAQLSAWLKITFERSMSPALRATPLEQSAYSQIAALLNGLQRQPPPGKALRPKELWAHLLEVSQGMTIRVTGEPMAGVQILSLAEARWLPVQVAFVLGCNEGFFPRALPADELITDGLKKRLGLKGWQGLEAMEDLSFSLLKARIPKVFLCRSQSFAGEDKVPSRFLEQLQGQGHHPVVQVAARSPAPQLAQAPQLTPATIATGHGEGRIPEAWRGDWLGSISATAVDKFLSCPFRYALDNLQLSRVESPFDDKTAIEEGVVYHRVFEQFHSGLAAIQLPPLPEQLPAEEAAARLQERFRALLAHHLPEGYESTPEGVQLLTVGIPRYIEHIIALSETMGQPRGEQRGATLQLVRGESEREFSPQHATTFAIGGKERRLSGQVDRIDALPEVRVITDFKRDGVPKAAAGELGSAQLLLYARGLEAATGMPTAQMILGYWSILKGEWLPLAVGEPLRDFAIAHGLATKKTPAIAELWQQLDSAFAEREEQVAEQQRYFAADGSCSFCPYDSFCRRHDPGMPLSQGMSRISAPAEEVSR